VSLAIGFGPLPAGAPRERGRLRALGLGGQARGARAWNLAACPAPGPVVTAYTISLADPETMEARARANAHRPLLKIKLGTEGDMPPLEAVRRGAPAARLIVDANEGWTPRHLRRPRPASPPPRRGAGEQPLPADQDEALAQMARPLPVCADESCHDRASLPALKGRYDMVNIKLDKTGGLTEALALREEGAGDGPRIMVGCMDGTSLAMAPAVLAQAADSGRPLPAPCFWPKTAPARSFTTTRGSIRHGRSSGDAEDPHRLRERRLPSRARPGLGSSTAGFH
jgi:L-alanine-DL-glutamate epimerase-like enolase superfamily enzyme